MTYLSEVLADSPRHYWRCADPGGVLLHDIGSSPLALLTRAGDQQVGYSGPISDGGSVVISPGVGAYAIGLDDVLSYPLTFECIFWPAEIGNSTQVIISAWGNGGASVCSARLLSNNTVQVFAASGLTVVTASATKQNWHHLVVVDSGGTMTVYLDGSSAGTNSSGSYSSTSTSFGVGCDSNDLSKQFWGGIAEYAVYTTGLSSGRVSAHFAAIDSLTARPVWNAGHPNDLSGIPPNAAYSDILDKILAAVQKTFPST